MKVKHRVIVLTAPVLLFILPIITSAAADNGKGGGGGVTYQSIIDGITSTIFQPIAYLLFSLGFLIFMWGLIEFIANPTNASIKEKGKQHMIFGILGLLIMVSVWGIVNLITSTLGISCDGLGSGKPCQ